MSLQCTRRRRSSEITPEVEGRRKGGRGTCPDCIVRRPHVSHNAREVRVGIYERIRRLDGDLAWHFVVVCRLSVVSEWFRFTEVAHVGKNSAGSIRGAPLAHASQRGEFELDSIGSPSSPYSPSPSFLTRPQNMSAVRRGDRRAARGQHSSPYSRPNAQPKKSVRPHVYCLCSLPACPESAHICASPGHCRASSTT